MEWIIFLSVIVHGFIALVVIMGLRSLSRDIDIARAKNLRLLLFIRAQISLLNDLVESQGKKTRKETQEIKTRLTNIRKRQKKDK